MEKPTYDELGERNPELQYGVELEIEQIVEVSEKVVENSTDKIDVSHLVACLDKIKRNMIDDSKSEK